MLLSIARPANCSINSWSGIPATAAWDRRTGSLAQAGLTTGAAAIGFAVTGPALGRLVDRVGAARPLITTAVVNAGMFAALIAAVHVGAPLAVLAGCAVFVGGSLPPVSACQRAMWRRLLADRPDMLDTAMAVDSFQLDVFLILGPLLVTGVTALAGASVALGLVRIAVTFLGNALGTAIAGVLIDHATWRSPAAAAALVLAAAAALIRWRQPLLRKAIHGAPA